MKLSQIVQAGTRLRIKGGRGRVVVASDADVWKHLLTHIPFDVKMDKSAGGGYIPAAGVLANREESRQTDEIKSIGQ